MPTNPPDSPDAARSTPVEAPPSEPYFGCFTGDCPHTKHSECDAAIREHCAELERENAVLSGRASERAPDDILATFRRYAEAASEYADCLKRAYMGDFRSVAEDRDLDDAVRELREVRTEFVAELTHLRAERDTLRRFCGVALQATRVHEIGDWDGGDLQDAMLSCGLIAEVQATEPCGEACRCAEYDDFPQTCYRVSGLGERCLAARPTSSTAEGLSDA